jgi:uncharacterized protein YprB with RNaseH-like and TPR domain
MTDLGTVAFDIETTGFAVDDQLTVVGFDADIGSRIFLNTGDRSSSSDLEGRINEKLNHSVSVSVVETEQVLQAVRGECLGA